jgi:hypothetical protein
MWPADEKRRHLRYTYLANTEYMLNPPTSSELFECAVVNVSDSGMNLFISRPLDMGQEITIRGEVPNLARTAVVRWTKKLGGFYAVGLECNDPERGGELRFR